MSNLTSKKTSRKASSATKAGSEKPCIAKGAEAKKRVVLSVKVEPDSTVYLAGSFNDWSATDKKLVDKQGNGIFTTTVTLPPGIYEYKFVINGVWTLDPDPDRDWTQNGLGTLNSVLRVG